MTHEVITYIILGLAITTVIIRIIKTLKKGSADCGCGLEKYCKNKHKKANGEK